MATLSKYWRRHRLLPAEISMTAIEISGGGLPDERACKCLPSACYTLKESLWHSVVHWPRVAGLWRSPPAASHRGLCETKACAANRRASMRRLPSVRCGRPICCHVPDHRPLHSSLCTHTHQQGMYSVRGYLAQVCAAHKALC